MSLHHVRAITRDALSLGIESLQYPQISVEEMYAAREEVGDVIAESLYDYKEQENDRDTVARLQVVSDEVSRTVEMIEGTDVLTGGDVEILNASLEGLTRLMGHAPIRLELGENGKLTQPSFEGLSDFFSNLGKAIAGVVKRIKGRSEINRNRSEGYLTGIRKQLAFCHNGLKENLSYAGGDEVKLPMGWAEAFTIAGAPSKDYVRDVKAWLEFTDVVYSKSVPFRLKTAEQALAGIKALQPGEGLEASLKKAWSNLHPDTSVTAFIGNGRNMLFNRTLEVNKAIQDNTSMPDYAQAANHICTKVQWTFQPTGKQIEATRKQPDAATVKQWLAVFDTLVKHTEGQLYSGGGVGRKYWNEYDRLIDQLTPALEAMESKLDRGALKAEQGWAINGLAHCVGTVLDVLTDDMSMVNSYSMRLSTALAWQIEEWIQKARKEA